MKMLCLSLVFELAAVEFIYLLLARFPDSWWLWAGLAALVFTALLANLAPVLIFPLFAKLTPLPEGDVRRRALPLAPQARPHALAPFPSTPSQPPTPSTTTPT